MTTQHKRAFEGEGEGLQRGKEGKHHPKMEGEGRDRGREKGVRGERRNRNEKRDNIH